MTGSSLLMSCTVYRDRSTARGAAREIEDLVRGAEADIDGAAIVAKDPSGKISLDDLGQRSMEHGSAHGAVLGAVVGLMFPPSQFASAFLGATIGALVGRLDDRDLDDEALRQIGHCLGTGQAAIVVVGQADAVELILAAQRDYQTIARRALGPDLVAAATDRS
jgi:uncharacterized membrane protein